MKTLFTAILLAAAFTCNTAHAQRYNEEPFFTVERLSGFVAIGGQNYLGDLLPRNYGIFGATYDFAPSVKLGADYEITPAFRVRLGYLGTKLYGNDASAYQNYADALEASIRTKRQISMTCTINEFSLNAIFDVFGLIQNKRENWRVNITPYVGVGIGYAFTNLNRGDTTIPYRYAHDPNSIGASEAKYYDRDFRRKPITGALVFPVMAGALWQVNPNHSAFVEVSRHYAMTDYLDGVSNWNTKASSNDGYINYAIGYRYTFKGRY